MVVNHREGIVDLAVMKGVIGTIAVLVVERAGWNPIHGVGQAIFGGKIGIDTSIELPVISVCRIEGNVVGDIGDVGDTSSDTWVGRAVGGGRVLGSSGGLHRRSKIEALPGDGVAIGAFHQADIPATLIGRYNPRGIDRASRKVEKGI